ncbi:MAG: sugar phosphate isomerase/epimerase [Clostridia bacterium]|nr:sugar phosphate isomerase/epimerase [Clostridia bacterium]
MLKIGAQMYTIRDYCKSPEAIIESLKKLAAMGYRWVQYSGCAPIDPTLMRKTCEELGLEVVITHTPYDRIIGDTDAVIAQHKEMGCGYIGLGSMPDFARGDVAGLTRFFEEMAEPVEKIHAAGLRFGYHNHSFEFVKLEGQLLFDRMLDRFPADKWGIIMDTYWVQHGGADIYQWIEKTAGRLYCVHLKDMAMRLEGGQKMAAVGEGNLNFPAILPAFEAAGAEYAFVEQDDCHGEDPFVCLERSLRYLRSLEYTE